MRISELKLYPVAIADGPLRSSYGRHAPYALRTIVEVRSDDGLTGVSETYGGDGPLAALEAARPRILGMDPFQLTGLWMDFTKQTQSPAAAVAGGRTQTYLVPGSLWRALVRCCASSEAPGVARRDVDGHWPRLALARRTRV